MLIERLISIWCFENPFPEIPPGFSFKGRRALEIE